ncbi:MAG: ABC transporter permease [Ruminococcaceae bacterium]|nr:ABC transporter permease [Oscillospiraceae bacterium]
MDELELKQKENSEETPLDKNVRLMSPTQMLLRRFFRSKLSILGLVMVIGLFLFCFLGPVFYTQWSETQVDRTQRLTQEKSSEISYTVDGVEYEVKQVRDRLTSDNYKASPSGEHLLGTDNMAYDVLARLMYGGRVSLLVSFMTVILMTILGVIIGGIAGYFGGVADNIIMRICDILMCLPGIPILMILSSAMDGWVEAQMIEEGMRIYILMFFLTLISWPGIARLVRGQILSLREQEYMVAAEAMGYSTSRKIFKHLVPNVMPQLIVQMSLSLGSMILYEATLSYLNMGIKAPYTAWGSMINIITTDPDILQNYPFIWVPAGVCIVIAVLGFNFVGDGLRDALDPKARR